MSEPDPSSIVVVSDLDSRGRLGRTTLTIDNGIATKTELTPLGEETIGQFTVTELSNPRLEDLVDATALIADFEGHSVELIRSTNRQNLPLASLEKQLKALVAGKPAPPAELETMSARSADDHCRSTTISVKRASIGAKLCFASSVTQSITVGD